MTSPRRNIGAFQDPLGDPKVLKSYESDWQTVTTEYMETTSIHPRLHHNAEIGSSLADVSSASEDTFDDEHGSEPSGLTIRRRHQQDYKVFDVYTRNKRHLISPGGQAKLNHIGSMATPRAFATIRRISCSLEGTAKRWGSKALGAGEVARGFGSVSSDLTLDHFTDSPNIRESNIAELQQMQATSKRFIPENPEIKSCIHPYCASPHDRCSIDIPRLPFPLISLPQAAKLQHIRRECGEEDHTDNGSSFMNRAVSATVSTVSSCNSPKTPQSVHLLPNYYHVARNASLDGTSQRQDFSRPKPHGKLSVWCP